MLRLLVVVLCLGVAAATSSAPCCPSCPDLFHGRCPAVNEMYGPYYPKGGECVEACPGSCSKTLSTGYVCGLEPCGPDPCATTDADADAGADSTATLNDVLFSKPVGFCAAGSNTSYPTLDTPGWQSSYAYHVAMAHMMRPGQQTVLSEWPHDTEEMHMHVPRYGNSLYYPVHVNGKQWTLHRMGSDGGSVDLGIDLGTGSYPNSYSASDDIVVVGHYSIGFSELHWTAYSTTQANTSAPISDMASVPVYQGSIPFPAVVHNSTVFVLIPDGPSLYGLYIWDATAADPSMNFKRVNVTVSGCNVLSTDEASLIKSMSVTSDGTAMYFTAEKPLSTTTLQLCQVDLGTGVVKPLLSNPHYTRSRSYVEVTFDDHTVVYSAATGSNVEAGDMMVCIGLRTAQEKCVWIKQDMQTNVKYAFTSMYTGYHFPNELNTRYAVAVYTRADGHQILLYRTAPGDDLTSIFAYDLVDRTVTPVALVYDIPNTSCGSYTGDNSPNIEEFSFNSIYVMANGTIVSGLSYQSNMDAHQQMTSVVTIHKPAVLRPDLSGCSTGCSVHGGVCMAGQCTCLPGCTGTDCSQQVDATTNATYCNPPVATDDDW